MNIYIALGIFAVLGAFGFYMLCNGDSSLQTETIDYFNTLVTTELINP